MTAHYANGQLTEGLDWQGQLSQQYGDDDWDKVLQRAGYAEATKIGRESNFTITLYQHENGERPDWLPPFFIEMERGNGFEYISAATFPDVLDLMARWAPVASAAILTDAFDSVFIHPSGTCTEG